MKELIDDLRAVRVQRKGRLTSELGPSVEPVQLQVVCRQLWSRMDPAAATIEVEDIQAVGDVDNALSTFYDETVAGVAERTGVDEASIRSWIESRLITEQGMRAQVLEGPGVRGDDVLRELEAAHLIRADQHGSAQWYELAHDRLVDPVGASNDAWEATHVDSLRVRAQAWSDQGRPEDLLIGGRRLKAAEAWGTAHADDLWPIDREFLRTSRLAQRRSRRVLSAAVVVIILLAALCIVATILASVSRASERAADEQTTAHLLAVQSGVTVRTGTPLSLVLAAESAKASRRPTSDAVAALVNARTASSREWAVQG